MTEQQVDVVAVAPHPDDLEILCGGTLAKLSRQGYRTAIIDLTTGEPTPRGSEESRTREAEEARRLLGVPLRINLGLPNRTLMDTPENRFALATALRRLRPTIVIGAHGRTPAASPDHYQGQLLVEAARFYSQLTKWDERFDGTPPWRVAHLVYALFPLHAEVTHHPSTFVMDISDTFDAKMQSIQAYRSQFDDSRFARVRHMVSGFNASTGARCGFLYGELFALPGPVGASDLVALVTGAKAASAAPVALPGQPPPNW